MNRTFVKCGPPSEISIVSGVSMRRNTQKRPTLILSDYIFAVPVYVLSVINVSAKAHARAAAASF